MAEGEAKLNELRKKAAELERQKVVRQTQADQAEAQLREVAKRLFDEFGCRSLEEAKILLNDKQSEFNKLLAEIEGLLK